MTIIVEYPHGVNHLPYFEPDAETLGMQCPGGSLADPSMGPHLLMF